MVRLPPDPVLSAAQVEIELAKISLLVSRSGYASMPLDEQERQELRHAFVGKAADLLDHVPEALRLQVRARLEALVEQTPELSGIELTRDPLA